MWYYLDDGVYGSFSGQIIGVVLVQARVPDQAEGERGGAHVFAGLDLQVNMRLGGVPAVTAMSQQGSLFHPFSLGNPYGVLFEVG